MSNLVRIAKISADNRVAAAAISDDGATLLGPWRDDDPFAAPLILPAPDEAANPNGEFLKSDQFSFLPPISAATKIICLGLNYRDHAEEAGEAPPENPALFVKLPDSFVGHDNPIYRPRLSAAFDFEGEIAVVIGRAGRHIAKEDAMAHVYGYTALMDGSVRDYQQHSISAGKCFYQSSSIGPWIVPAESIADQSAMSLTTRLNGEEVQTTDTSRMIYDVATAISYISRWTPLNRGDIVSTGTPSGVGAMRQPPLWMNAGDVIEVSVGGVGALRNNVVDEQ